MRSFHIWCEGYQANEGISGATRLTREPIQAASLSDAIETLMEQDPYHKSYFSKKRNRWTYWGCRVFDNEGEARASFGWSHINNQMH